MTRKSNEIELIRIIHLISSFRRGGRERQLATICRYSDTDRINTLVVCLNRTVDSYVEEYGMEKNVLYLESRSFKGRLMELSRIIRCEKPDVIWSWGGLEATFGLLLALIIPIKHINGSVRHGIVRFNRKQLWRMLILHLSSHIVANSRAGLKANRLKRGEVMYNGLDEKFFEPPPLSREEIRNKLHIVDEKVCLVSVANLVPYKDYTTVIKALSLLKKNSISFHYLIVGEGPERQRIERLIRENDLVSEAILLGRRTDVKQILHAADIFVHSSRGEGCSNAILEAMAAGLPIIASDTGGTREIVNDDNGLLFRLRDETELFHCILNLLTDPRKITELKTQSAIAARQRFELKNMMARYIGIVNSVIS